MNVVGSESMTLHEVHEASSFIEEQGHEDAVIIWGASINPSLGDEILITVIATGFDNQSSVSTKNPTQEIIEKVAEPPIIEKQIPDLKEVGVQPKTTRFEPSRPTVATVIKEEEEKVEVEEANEAITPAIVFVPEQEINVEEDSSLSPAEEDAITLVAEVEQNKHTPEKMKSNQDQFLLSVLMLKMKKRQKSKMMNLKSRPFTLLGEVRLAMRRLNL